MRLKSITFTPYSFAVYFACREQLRALGAELRLDDDGPINCYRVEWP